MTSGQDSPGRIPTARIDDTHVAAAIDALSERLLELSDEQGSWEPRPWPSGQSRQDGGYTALAVLALRSAGLSPQDPRLKPSISLLSQMEPSGTYARSIRAMVWSRMPESSRPLLEEDARWLIKAWSPRSAGWDYRSNPTSSRRDNSITQIALLALHAAAERGIEVPPRILEAVEARFMAMQLRNGAWDYQGKADARGSMTAAGIATLALTRQLLHAEEALKLDRSRERPIEEAIEHGLTWLDRHFVASENPGYGKYLYYYLWTVERAGMATGVRSLGGKDWFRMGTAELLERLLDFDPATGTFTVHDNEFGDGRRTVIGTRQLSFALLFLSKGRIPIGINKLRFDGRWNNRPLDAANTAKFIGDSGERRIAWQVVDMNDPVQQWLDAPILYIATDQETAWADPTRLDKLVEYMHRGGLIVVSDQSPGQRLGRILRKNLPERIPSSSWRAVKRDDPIRTILFDLQRKRVNLASLHNGVRDMLILVDNHDLAGSLQLPRRANQHMLQMMANIWAVASERNQVGPRLKAKNTPVDPPSLPRTVTILRPRHEDAWNPEPGAQLLLAEHLARTGIRLETIEVSLEQLHEHPGSFAWLCGVDPIQLDDTQVQAIQQFIGQGGSLLIETVGGRGEFAASLAEQLCRESHAEEVPLHDHAVIAGNDQMEPFGKAWYRQPILDRFGAGLDSPRLSGIRIDGSTRIFISREDLSHALLGTPRWNIHGYRDETAYRLLDRLLAIHAQDTRPDPEATTPGGRTPG